MLKALVFDVDGTLADTEEAHRRAFNAAFREHGLDWVWSVELYGELLRVTGGKERIRADAARRGLSTAERARLEQMIPALHATKTEVYTQLVQVGGIPLRAGVLSLIQAAHAADVAVAIASTTTFDNVHALLTANLGPDALGYFAAIAAGDVVRRKKPAPDIYELALRSLDIPARSAVAIEDSEIGVQAAKSAGLFTLVTPSRWTAAQSFAAADLVVRSLADVSLEQIQSRHARTGDYS